MARAAVSYFWLLLFLWNYFMESAVGQTIQKKNSWNVIEELQILSRAVADLTAKLDGQATLLANLETKADIHHASLTNLNANHEIQALSLSCLEAQSQMQQNTLNNLATKAATQETLSTHLQAQSNVQTTLLGKIVANLEIQLTSVKKVVAEQEWKQPASQYNTNRTIVVLEGDDVEMWCVVRGTPLPEIQWRREEGTLAFDRVEISNNGGALRIKNVQLRDQGTYICIAANGVGTPVFQSITLEVYVAAQQCHRVIESNTGNLEITTLSIGCLWIIQLENKTGFRLDLDPLMTEHILVIPEQNSSSYDFQFVGITAANSLSHEFEGKILAILVPPGRERTTLNWTGLAVDNSRASSNDSDGTSKWEQKRDGTHNLFWAIKHEMPIQLNWKLKTVFPSQDQQNYCELVSFEILEIEPDGDMSEIQRACKGSSYEYLNFETISQMLDLLKSVNGSRLQWQVTWKYHPETLNINAEGIFAGIDGGGAVVMTLNSTRTKTISSRTVNGLASDRHSQRMYWLENGVGIMRSKWDGSDSEIVFSDPFSKLYGMATEPISGNWYYGSRTSRTIRACNNKLTKCSSISNSSELSNVYDIAVHQSKGLLFWSIHHKQVVQAHLDGSNAKVILVDGTVQGIDVDEHEDRLYWGSNSGISSCDLHGRDKQMVPNVAVDVQDVAIHTDKVYYVNWSTTSIHVISKLGTSSRLVAQLTSSIWHLAFFSARVSKQPSNLCKNAKCTHLCVLMKPWQYRCMCPDSKELNPDGKTCKI